MTRPFVRIWGIAYTGLLKGKNPTRRVTASHLDRDALYRDPAIRLSEADLAQFNGLDGKPICVEHDPNVVVGHIHHHEVDAEGTIRVMARVYTDTPEGRDAAERLQRGELKGLSVGYEVRQKRGTDKVSSKSFEELTLTEEPFFENCLISVQASRNPQKNLEISDASYKSNRIWIELSRQLPNEMSTSQTPENTTAAAPASTEAASQTEAAAPQVPRTEQGELLKTADTLKETALQAEQKRRQAEKEAEATRKELEILRAYVAADEKRYAEEKRPEAEEITALQEELSGRKFTTEERQEMIEVCCSKKQAELADMLRKQAYNFKAQREAAVALEEKHKIAMSKIKALEEERDSAVTSINASRKSMLARAAATQMDEEEEEDPAFRVAASADGEVNEDFPLRGLRMDQIMIPKPSAIELQHPLFRYRQTPTIAVTASKKGGEDRFTIAAAARHPYVDELPYSQRNRLGHWFALMTRDASFRHDPRDSSKARIVKDTRDVKDGRDFADVAWEK